MADQGIPVHSGKIFSWHDGVGTAYLSDITKGQGHFPTWGRFFNGQSGFFVVSHRTGTNALFVLTGEDRDGSGEDIYGFHFEAIDPALRAKNVRILIIND